MMSKAAISASMANLIHFASCTETPSPLLSDDQHCDRLDANISDVQFGDLGDIADDYPNEIECWENAHHSFTLHNLDVREKMADGSDSIHLFSARPDKTAHQDNIETFAWNTAQKIVNLNDLPPFRDVEFGFISPHGTLARSLDHQRRTDIQNKNFGFQSKAERNQKTLESRLGPPLLNASELHGLATWLKHFLECREQQLRRARITAGRNNLDTGGRLSRLEQFLQQPLESLAVYNSKFVFYNDS